MSIDKKIKYNKPVVQGGVDNYLGKQPQVQAPRKWNSAPDKPATELAYITEAEKDLILKTNLHGGLEKGPNIGPSGIMSLDSYGDIGGAGAGGADTAAGGGYDTGSGGGGFSGQAPGQSDRDFDRQKANERAALQIANKYGYTDVLPDGSLKPGFGGRLFGGLMSLLTGIPFVGGAIGTAYDYGKGIFKDKYYDDMSQYSGLGLYDDKMKQRAFYDDALYSDNYSDMKIPGAITDVDEVSMETVDEYGNTYRDSPYSNQMTETQFEAVFGEQGEPG